MLTVKELISRVRVLVHDTDEITYDDEEVLRRLNDGLRFIRRQVIARRPEMLAEECKGVLQAGERLITLPQRPVKVVEVRAGDEIINSVTRYNSAKVWHNHARVWHNQTRICTQWEDVTRRLCLLPEASAFEVRDMIGETGRPQVFCRTGMASLSVYPVPEVETGWQALCVPDLKELGMNDTSPLLLEFDDYIMEYAELRLSMGNEYNVSQEIQVMTAIVNQLDTFLALPPSGVEVRSYWDGASGSVVTGW